MNQLKFEDEDPMQDFDIQTLDTLSHSAIKSKFLEERQRCLVLEKDLFKSQTEGRRLIQQNKTLQELNTLNAKNRNNTSSAFTLPSEFKSAWDELVKELILDAFPDFLDRYEELVPLVQELFIVVRMEIIQIQRDILSDVGKRLKLFDDKSDKDTIENVMGYLDTKFQVIFQEYSLKVFYLSDEQIHKFVMEKYKPRCEGIVSQRDGAEDDFEDNISTPDFKRFVRAVMKLSLHMVLNDPPILLNMECWETRQHKSILVEKFEFWMYNKNDYYCIDGFPKEGNPCVVVLPPPYRQGYVYQGIKPAVIVLDDPDDEVVTHVRAKQEELLEKLKAKRQLSLCGLEQEQENKQNDNQNQNIEQQNSNNKLNQSNRQSIQVQQEQINIVNLNPSKKDNLLQQPQIETPQKQKSSSNNKSKIIQSDNDLDKSLEKLQQEIQQFDDENNNENQTVQLSTSKQSSPCKSIKSQKHQTSQQKQQNSSQKLQLPLKEINNVVINNSDLISAVQIMEDVSQTFLIEKPSTTKNKYQYNKYCCLSPNQVTSPLNNSKNNISSKLREKSSERTNKSNSKRLNSLNKTSKISKFDLTQSVLANRTGRDKVVQSSMLLQSKQLALQQEEQQQLTQRSIEPSVKSPTRSEILKTLYNDYANLKNKQITQTNNGSSLVTLNSSQKQLFSDRKGQEKQNQFQEEDEAIQSARRRLSNNFQKVGTIQLGKQTNYKMLDSRNNNASNLGSQNTISLSISQSQVFISSKQQQQDIQKSSTSKLNLQQNNKVAHNKNQPSIDSSKSGRSIHQDIKSQIRKLAETMKSTQQQSQGGNSSKAVNDKYTTNNYINQQDYQSKVNQPTIGFSYYQKMNQTSQQQQQQQNKNHYININQSKQALNAKAFEKFNKNIEMPKKITTQTDVQSSTSSFYNQQMRFDFNQKTSRINESDISQTSTISQMHMQKGLTDFKEDLQRKIQSYQSLLKKTDRDQNKQLTSKLNTNKYQAYNNNSQKGLVQGNTFDYESTNKFTTLDTNKSRYVVNQTNKHGQNDVKINNYTVEDDVSQHSQVSNNHTKIQKSANESLQQLKSAFFSKIHSYHQQYEQSKQQFQANQNINQSKNQSQTRMSDRSKSPLQKNLPRQYIQDGKTSTYKIIGGGNTNATIVPRKSTIQYDDLSSSDTSSSGDERDLNQRQVIYNKGNINMQNDDNNRVLKSQNLNTLTHNKIINNNASLSISQCGLRGKELVQATHNDYKRQKTLTQKETTNQYNNFKSLTRETNNHNKYNQHQHVQRIGSAGAGYKNENYSNQENNIQNTYQRSSLNTNSTSENNNSQNAQVQSPKICVTYRGANINNNSNNSYNNSVKASLQNYQTKTLIGSKYRQ